MSGNRECLMAWVAQYPEQISARTRLTRFCRLPIHYAAEASHFTCLKFIASRMDLYQFIDSPDFKKLCSPHAEKPKRNR